jgi:hypothetical protein
MANGRYIAVWRQDGSLIHTDIEAPHFGGAMDKFMAEHKGQAGVPTSPTGHRVSDKVFAIQNASGRSLVQIIEIDPPPQAQATPPVVRRAE